jgi:hypothetical protein
MFLITLASILGLMALGFNLLYFSAGEYKNLCTYDVSHLYDPGTVGIVASLFLSLICVW